MADRWTLSILVLVLAIGTPVFVVIGHVFLPAGEVWDHLARTVLPVYVANTLWLMFGVGTGTTVIGVGTAWLVTLYRFPLHRAFEWALLLPLAVPAYVIAYTYTGLLDFAGPVQSGLRAWFGWSRQDYWFPPIRSLGGAIAMFTLVLYPYVYLMARAAFTEQSVCVLEASRTLGAGPWRTFYAVGLPLARPAVAGGVALALMETLNDFGMVQYFAVDTFTTGIFRTWFGLGEPSAAAQLAAVLLIFVLVLVAIERWSRGGARYHQTSSRYRRLPSHRLGGWSAALALAAVATPVALGFLVPVAVLLTWTLGPAGGSFDDRFVRHTANSLILAATAAAVAVALATVLAYGLRLRPTPHMRFMVRMASLGYAVPGAVIAVGVLLPASWLDQRIDAWARAALGVSTGLVLTGGIALVCFAYLVRFLAVAFNAVEASLEKVTRSMDDAARILGSEPFKTLMHVHLVLVRPSLLAAGLLVFVEVTKELPATLILRPFNFDTLAIRTYELASDERLAEAGLPALAILAVSILPVVLLSQALTRSRPGHAQR